MTPMPTVSVLMLSHRAGPHFEPAVRSVLSQTYRDLELVLVDNGSGLGLAPLGATGRDPRIRLFTLPVNQGIAAGFNYALAQAQGHYVMLHDYDDLSVPQRLEKQVAFLEANPRYGLVTCYADTIDANGHIVGREFCLVNERDQRIYSQFSTPIAPAAYIGPRVVFARHPFRDRFRWCSDFDMIARVAEVHALAGLPEVLLQYRRYPDQTTVVWQSARMVEVCAIRLLTARRRAGRDEQCDALLAEMKSWFNRPPPPADLYAAFARRFLGEGFAAMAVYHARQLIAAGRNPRALAAACRICLDAVRKAPAESPLLMRLFLRGPVRAYGLKHHPGRR